MTWDDERHFVGRACARHRTRRARMADGRRDVSIRAGLSIGDFGQRLPHKAAESGCRDIQRQAAELLPALDVPDEAGNDRPQGRIVTMQRGCAEFAPQPALERSFRVAEVDGANPSRACGHEQFSEARVDDREIDGRALASTPVVIGRHSQKGAAAFVQSAARSVACAIQRVGDAFAASQADLQPLDAIEIGVAFGRHADGGFEAARQVVGTEPEAVGKFAETGDVLVGGVDIPAHTCHHIGTLRRIRLWATAPAGPVAGLARADGVLEERDAVEPRPPRSTGRAAKDTRRAYPVHKGPVGAAVPGHHCKQTRIGLNRFHGFIVRHGKVHVYPNLVLKPSMFDAIVLGLGGMGSAAAAHIAARGKRVLGLEQFTPAHDRGSSHGQTRIIRQAYFEDPAYVPLLLRAYDLWFDLERRSGRALYLRTGGLMVGGEDSALIAGSRRSALEHGLKHEMLDARDVRARFPATRPRSDEVALFEEPAGILFPEACVRAHIDWAAKAGAELRFETRVVSWEAKASEVATVTTDAGERFEAQSLIICAGAWLTQQAKELGLPLRVERNVVHWFAPAAHSELFGPERLPIYMLERDPLSVLYGFPSVGGEGIKAAFHHSHKYTTPDEIERDVAPAEVQRVRDALQEWLPDGNGAHIASSVCMYTLTPDEHFLIGRHPCHPSVIVAGGFSGHGFKFCSVVGEVLADLALNGETRHRIGLFNFERLTQK